MVQGCYARKLCHVQGSTTRTTPKYLDAGHKDLLRLPLVFEVRGCVVDGCLDDTRTAHWQRDNTKGRHSGVRWWTTTSSKTSSTYQVTSWCLGHSMISPTRETGRSLCTRRRGHFEGVQFMYSHCISASTRNGCCTHLRLRVDWAPLVYRLADHVHDTSKGLLTHGHHDRCASVRAGL